MTTHEKPEDHPGVARIKQMWDRGDFETLDRMVRFWEALEKLGLLGDLLRRFIIWSGAIAAGYLAFNGFISEWIKSVMRQ